jgi:CheY-like chemotaxis protein
MQSTEPTLLIADDDRDFRESLSEVFTRRGFTTQLAANGSEAVEIVQATTHLHLVLLDVHMPKLSGIEALGKIREIAAEQLPCILMSAKFDAQIVQEAQRLQIETMLSKPFTLRDLTGTVESVFEQSYGWRL